MTYKSLPNRMKIKVRLAEAMERNAEDAVSVDARYMFLERAEQLWAEVEAFTAAEIANR